MVRFIYFFISLLVFVDEMDVKFIYLVRYKYLWTGTMVMDIVMGYCYSYGYGIWDNRVWETSPIEVSK